MTVQIGDSINSLENSLRDLIEPVLKNAHGDTWLDHLGVSDDRVEAWKDRRQEEPKRRPGGQVEERLLYYSEFHDIVNIIKKNWEFGFKDCFMDRKRFDVYTDRLSAFRNPDAHSRALLPFEEHLVLGITGELRQEITLFLSSGGGGPEPEHFARIEEIRDSYGTRVTGTSVRASDSSWVQSPVVLRPGDTVSFTGRAWDPEGAGLKWLIYAPNRVQPVNLEDTELNWTWTVEESDISERCEILFAIRSPRSYSRLSNKMDDRAALVYRVLPPRP